MLVMTFSTNAAEQCERNIDSDKRMDWPLRKIIERYYDGEFYLGTAHHATSIDKLSGKIAVCEFNYITPSNDFKQSGVHPTFEKWNWTLPDTYLKHSRKHGQVLRIHGPIGPQCSPWVREDHRTPEELSRMLEEYMTALCKRYNGCKNILWLDVVNETIGKTQMDDEKFGATEAGSWLLPRSGNSLWENPWTIIGFDEESDIRVPLYIDKAFELSNHYAPDIKQIINQHGSFEPVVWEKMKKLVKYLRSRGRRVDGIGWQAHITTGWEKEADNMQRLNEFISWCHEHDLEFHITEMNVWMKTSSHTEAKQADTYGAIIGMMLDHRHEGVTGVNFWNVIDQETGHPEWNGCLWRNDGTPRPAYFRIKKELIKRIR